MDVQEIFTEVLKWAVLIFLAGFIGYFGRHLSKKVIDFFRARAGKSPQSTEEIDALSPPPAERRNPVETGAAGITEEQGLKENKKRDKDMLKREKKTRKGQEKREKAKKPE